MSHKFDVYEQPPLTDWDCAGGPEALSLYYYACSCGICGKPRRAWREALEDGYTHMDGQIMGAVAKELTR